MQGIAGPAKVGARTLLGAPGVATRRILTTSNKKLRSSLELLCDSELILLLGERGSKGTQVAPGETIQM